MINKTVINAIYRMHSRVPKDVSELNIDKMISSLAEFHNISEQDGFLVLDDIKEYSPFKQIPIKKIYGIEYLDKNIALVLHTCIIFFNKNSDEINIHIKLPKQSIFERIKAFFSK